MGPRWITAALTAFVLTSAFAAPAGAQLSLLDSPTVEGPIPSDAVGSASRDYPFGSSVQNLEAYDYSEQEYFYSGTTPVGSYKTRMVVRRPRDPASFSGTVWVEWQNVTNLYDLEALWARSGDHLMREGDAYVAIDAQTAGVTSKVTGLKAWSPKRYGSLRFPALAASLAPVNGIAADAGMFDIFGQGLRAVRKPGRIDPLGGLKPKTILATGNSQSALYLYLYAQTYDPVQRLTDGFLIAGASTATLGIAGQGSIALPVVAAAVPVMWLNSETDNSFIHQPDSSTYRLWEVAGTTHLDRDARDVQGVIVQRDFDKPLPKLSCGVPGFSRIPLRYAQNAAAEALKTWVTTGAAPRSQPGFVYDINGAIQRDGFGNILGGVRLPQFEVPTATNSRDNTGQCKALYGRSVPFSAQRLHVLYPTHADYVAKVQDATAAAVRSGILVDADAGTTLATARSAPTPDLPSRLFCTAPRVVTLNFPKRVAHRDVVSVRVVVGNRRPMRVRSSKLNVSLAGFGFSGAVPVRIDLRRAGARTRTLHKRFRTCISTNAFGLPS